MDQYEVRLDALDDLGNNRLPAIRDSLTTARNELKRAVEWITRTFDTRGKSMYEDKPFDTRMPYEHYLFWQPGNECYFTTDFMLQIFQDNSENVDLAAQAIREIAKRYRQVDGQA